jgi:hypothetical protein
MWSSNRSYDMFRSSTNSLPSSPKDDTHIQKSNSTVEKDSNNVNSFYTNRYRDKSYSDPPKLKFNFFDNSNESENICSFCDNISTFECNFCANLIKKGVNLDSIFFCSDCLNKNLKNHQKIHENLKQKYSVFL